MSEDPPGRQILWFAVPQQLEDMGEHPHREESIENALKRVEAGHQEAHVGTQGHSGYPIGATCRKRSQDETLKVKSNKHFEAIPAKGSALASSAIHNISIA